MSRALLGGKDMPGRTALPIPRRLSAGALRRFAVVGLLVGSLTAPSGAAAWTDATAATAHSGSIPIRAVMVVHRRLRRRHQPGCSGHRPRNPT